MSVPAGSALVVFLLAAAAGIWLSFTPPPPPPFQVVALALPETSPASTVSGLAEFDAGKAPAGESTFQPAGDETPREETSAPDQPAVAEAPIDVAALAPVAIAPEPVTSETPAPVAEPEPAVAEERAPVVAGQPESVAEPEAPEPEPVVAEAPEPVIEPVVEPMAEPQPIVAETPEPAVANETPALSDGIDAAAEDLEPFVVAALSPDEAEAVAPVASEADVAPNTDSAPEPEPEASTVPEAPAEPAAGPAPAMPAETWLAYARPFDNGDDRPRIAIVVAALGLGPAATRAAIQLPGAITLAFLSYARDLQQWIDLARAAGHEVLLDVPMEPVNYPALDPGPQALLTTLPSAENVARLKWHLGRATGYVGVTHNMGSLFTSSADDLRPVLSALKVRGLLFLDARTSSNSVAARLAATIGLPRAINDRFLDAQASRPAIDRRLGEIEAIALASGFSVAVGHPFPVTLERLGRWVAALDRTRFALAPISALVNRQAVR